MYSVHRHYAVIPTHTGGVGSIGKVVSVMNWKNETVVSVPCDLCYYMYNIILHSYMTLCVLRLFKLSILWLPFGGGRELVS